MQTSVRVEELSQVGEARRAAVQMSTRLALSDSRRGEVAIVATELATNVAPQIADTARERPLSVETTVAPSVIRDASRINRPGRPRS